MSNRYRRFLDRFSEAERASLFAQTCFLRLPGNVPPWTDTGIRVSKGERVSLLSEGRIIMSEELGLWAGARYHLWLKIGEDGPIFNGTRDTFTFQAQREGPLFVTIYHGEWKTREGELATPLELYEGAGGALDIFIIRWKAEPAVGLRKLREAAPDDPLIQAEIARLASPVRPPDGWRYLWFLGESEIFRGIDHDGHRAIALRADSDVGILQKSVDLELQPDTTLLWRWKVTELPATGPEDSMPTHDYLSIAVEFDNGRDLTWYWSAALAVGTSYACPLPTWTARETHLVVRSGEDGLGRWQAEQRNVSEDYRRAIGEPPKRIVAVWLIANSLFGHRIANAEFSDIGFAWGPRKLRVL